MVLRTSLALLKAGSLFSHLLLMFLETLRGTLSKLQKLVATFDNASLLQRNNNIIHYVRRESLYTITKWSDELTSLPSSFRDRNDSTQ